MKITKGTMVKGMAVLSCGLIVASAFSIVRSRVTKSTQEAQLEGYSLEESRAKLVAIGQSLLSYRSAHHVKPLSDWKVPADAGLPASPFELIEEGHPWTLPGGMQALRISHPRWAWELQSNGSHFGWTTINPETAWPEILRDRGERLIFCLDTNVETVSESMERRQHKLLVLRINGQVEMIEHETKIIGDVLAK